MKQALIVLASTTIASTSTASYYDAVKNQPILE